MKYDIIDSATDGLDVVVVVSSVAKKVESC